jgi:hypothetical protein
VGNDRNWFSDRTFFYIPEKIKTGTIVLIAYSSLRVVRFNHTGCLSNENTNGLLRQYFAQGINLSQHSQQKLNSVARQLSQRPRKIFGYTTPAERLNE